jgi:hypothetical protein
MATLAASAFRMPAPDPSTSMPATTRLNWTRSATILSSIGTTAARATPRVSKPLPENSMREEANDQSRNQNQRCDHWQHHETGGSRLFAKGALEVERQKGQHVSSVAA